LSDEDIKNAENSTVTKDNTKISININNKKKEQIDIYAKITLESSE
jgi:hypothetical protein